MLIKVILPLPPHRPYLPPVGHKLPFESQSPYPNQKGIIRPFYGHPKPGYRPPHLSLQTVNVVAHKSRLWLWGN